MIKVNETQVKDFADIHRVYSDKRIEINKKYQEMLEQNEKEKEDTLNAKIKELGIKEKIFNAIKNLQDNIAIEPCYLNVWGINSNGQNINIYIDKELNQVRYLSRVYGTGNYSLHFEEGYLLQLEGEQITFNKYAGYRKGDSFNVNQKDWFRINSFTNKAKITQKSIPASVWIDLYYILCLNDNFEFGDEYVVKEDFKFKRICDGVSSQRTLKKGDILKVQQSTDEDKKFHTVSYNIVAMYKNGVFMFPYLSDLRRNFLEKVI